MTEELKLINLLGDEPEQESEEEQKDFVEVPLLRGFTEIREIYDVATKNRAVICGGYARYVCSPQLNPVKPGDVDLFPQDESAFESLQQHFINLGFTVLHENDVSVTLNNPESTDTKWHYVPKVQLIKPVIEGAIVTLGTTEEILENFDFTVTRAAILDKNTVLVDYRFMEDEQNRYLRIINIHCPISSALRMCKYSKKGYFTRPIEMIKLFLDWDDRTDDYRERLVELFEKDGDKITEEEIDELEALLRID